MAAYLLSWIGGYEPDVIQEFFHGGESIAFQFSPCRTRLRMVNDYLCSEPCSTQWVVHAVGYARFQDMQASRTCRVLLAAFRFKIRLCLRSGFAILAMFAIASDHSATAR
ncbi:MAG: hypothetical protein D6742_07560 [Cyanobacteria bacterium J069]|nr:MAG: hypothetical protein D6742_07560 [Cyanobacteria bacterium J069]